MLKFFLRLVCWVSVHSLVTATEFLAVRVCCMVGVCVVWCVCVVWVVYECMYMAVHAGGREELI